VRAITGWHCLIFNCCRAAPASQSLSIYPVCIFCDRGTLR